MEVSKTVENFMQHKSVIEKIAERDRKLAQINKKHQKVKKSGHIFSKFDFSILMN